MGRRLPQPRDIHALALRRPGPVTVSTGLSAPAALRNRQPILEVLERHGPTRGTLLEIASGTGQHAVWFGLHLPNLSVQPSDPDPRHRSSIDAWRQESGCENVRAPLAIDVLSADWERNPALPRPIAAVVCINMIHIAPWEAALGLLRGAGALLPPTAPLILYGPYRRDGQHTAASNAQFDRQLRAHDPRFGVRNLERVAEAAASEGFSLEEVVSMPANNLSLILRKSHSLTTADPHSRA